MSYRASLIGLCTLAMALVCNLGPVSAQGDFFLLQGGGVIGNNGAEQVASLVPHEGAHPAVGPIGLNDIINEHVTATDIQTAWSGGKEIGWVYRGSDGHSYWQANYRYGESRSLFLLGFGTPIRLDSNVPILHQLPQDTQLLRGIDHSKRATLAHEGQTFNRSQVAIGDQIPNGTPGGTTVVDINTIKNAGNLAVGWVYRGEDGYNYFQHDYANQPSISWHWQVGHHSGDFNPVAYSDIHRYLITDLKPGEYLEQGAFIDRPTLDRDGGGLNGPGREITSPFVHAHAHNHRQGTLPHHLFVRAQGHSLTATAYTLNTGMAIG